MLIFFDKLIQDHYGGKYVKKSSVFFIYLLEIENLKEARFLERKKNCTVYDIIKIVFGSVLIFQKVQKFTM